MTALVELPAADELTASQLREVASAAVAQAFVAYTTEAQQAREDLYALTMSGLGNCTRQAAYRLARTPPSEPLRFAQMREANIGTMMHLGLLPRLAALLGGQEEIDVVLRVGDLTIKGRTDLYSAALKALLDLKTVGQYKFTALPDVANRAHRLQVAGYALAAVQDGKAVRFIAWIYVDRSSGAEYVVVEEWTDELVELVEQRCAELVVFAEEPDAAPRDERGPGLSVICDGCPWLRACWGEDAEPGVVGAQRILAYDHDGVAQALALYDKARAAESAAKADKEFARSMFAGYDTGRYGDFEFGWTSESEVEDKDAAVELLAAAGIPIPKKRSGRRVIVKRAK